MNESPSINKSFVIMGPSDVTKITRHTTMDKEYWLWLRELVKVSAETFDTLFFIPDHGVYVDFAMEFLKLKGKDAVIAVMPHGEQWLIQRAHEMGADKIHEMQAGVGWNYLNTHLVSLAPYALFLGYSSGSMLELMASKYIRVYENHPTRFFVDTRVLSVAIPLELVEDIETITYFSSAAELKKELKEYVG